MGPSRKRKKSEAELLASSSVPKCNIHPRRQRVARRGNAGDRTGTSNDDQGSDESRAERTTVTPEKKYDDAKRTEATTASQMTNKMVETTCWESQKTNPVRTKHCLTKTMKEKTMRTTGVWKNLPPLKVWMCSQHPKMCWLTFPCSIK